ncbi:gp082 [Rhodococcus phage ReqiPoco6]|uniref:Gp082 n=1 Tax=Rhodococcus phage ReqiPoco6 TaxID=691964 RepID=D4P7V0_9CAUD|nr:gp082 [Rhodococcus phage ReqiPoco6]ADD81080.1 gp082 [Rhodococcus phage ReqiPoco6]
MSDGAIVVLLIVVYYHLMALSLIYSDRLIKLLPRKLEEFLTKWFLKLAAIFNKLFTRIEGVKLKWKSRL